jgi:hypothetical protein
MNESKAIGAAVFSFLILVAATEQHLARIRIGMQSISPDAVFKACNSLAANIAQCKVVNAKFYQNSPQYRKAQASKVAAPAL